MLFPQYIPEKLLPFLKYPGFEMLPRFFFFYSKGAAGKFEEKNIVLNQRICGIACLAIEGKTGFKSDR